MNERKDTVDLMKLIGSLMIFAMHSCAFKDLGSLQFAWELLTRWAVPFFFMTSAYFLFSRGAASSDSVKKYVRRIGMLYLVWLAVNLPSVIYTRIISKNVDTLAEWLVLCKNMLLSSTFTGSWYLTSSIFCAILFRLLSKKLSVRNIVFCSIPVELVCILSSAYGAAFGTRVQGMWNFLQFPWNLVSGFFYFALGAYFAQNADILNKPKKSFLIAAAVFGFAAYAGEIAVTRSLGLYTASDRSFFVIPFGVSVFMLAMRSRGEIAHAKTLRKISTVVYCAQGNVLLAASGFRKLLGIDSSLLLFALSLLVMGGIAAIILLLQKHGVRWSKYLS